MPHFLLVILSRLAKNYTLQINGYAFHTVAVFQGSLSDQLFDRLPIRKYDPNLCFAVGDDTFDGLADEGIVIRQGAVADGGENGGQGLFPFVVLSAPLLHGLQALAEIVLFRHQGFQFRVVCAVVADGYRAQEVGEFTVNFRNSVRNILDVRFDCSVCV